MCLNIGCSFNPKAVQWHPLMNPDDGQPLILPRVNNFYFYDIEPPQASGGTYGAISGEAPPVSDSDNFNDIQPRVGGDTHGATSSTEPSVSC